MTVKQLIQELQKYPGDMPVATFNDISWATKDDPHWVRVGIATWVHDNYPYDKPDFQYVNLE